MSSKKVRVIVLLSFCLTTFFIKDSLSDEKSHTWLNNYLAETLNGLEKLRTQKGVLADKAILFPSGKYKLIHNATSPTNIGLDLILQASREDERAGFVIAQKNLSFLKNIERHKGSGLFFNWYTLGEKTQVSGKNISSIDNLHLAIGLWTISKKWPSKKIGIIAAELFQKMDFSMFVSSEKGLIGGNFSYKNGSWERDAYNFDHFGSEARSLYSIGLSLGVFKNFNATKVWEKTFENLIFNFGGETGSLLKTWDGGAFQLLLPELLISESNYSSYLKRSFEKYEELVFLEGQRLGFPFALGFSASSFGHESERFGDLPGYRGQLGHPSLVSRINSEFQKTKERAAWDQVMTPHALFLALNSRNLHRFQKSFHNMEDVADFGGGLYRKGWGFMDALHVKGPYRGQVVPSVLALDHLMIALSILKQTSEEGLAFERNFILDSSKKEKLTHFYRLLDQFKK